MTGGSRPRPVEALRSAATAEGQLEWEVVYDRRWRRHRDQLLTLAAVVLLGVGVATGQWAFAPLGVMGLAGVPAYSWWQARREDDRRPPLRRGREP